MEYTACKDKTVIKVTLHSLNTCGFTFALYHFLNRFRRNTSIILGLYEILNNVCSHCFKDQHDKLCK